jgi:hypothetical protein
MKDTPACPFQVSAGAYPNSVWSLVDMSRVFAPCRTAWHFCDLGPHQGSSGCGSCRRLPAKQ